jgi:hypothetical protein
MHDPIALGKHAPNIGMGWTGKHRTIKDPGSKTGRHVHVFQYTEEVQEVSQALGHKVAKARQAQASALRQKAVDEPDMIKAFSHTKAANKAERKAGQSYNRLMKKEEVELDEYNTKSSKAIVRKDNKPIAIYPDLKSAQKDYRGKDGHDIGMRSHSAAMRIKKENPGIKIVEGVEEVDEALTMSQRLQRARLMRRFASRIKIGQERAKRRIASPEKLQKRARRQARMIIFKKLTKDIPKSELTYARRQEIEKRLDKPAVKKRIERLAKRMLPKVRKAEIERKRGTSSND